MSSIAVIGVGYIGLVLGIALADFGNKITFADIDQKKIENLKKGKITIYEPDLQDLLNKNTLNNRIQFTTDIPSAIKSSSIIFIAVNTPAQEDGKSDISAVKKVSEEIGQNLNEEKIICIKSTVPIGTYKIVEDIIKLKNKDLNFDVVSIPEFLREGTALYDFINPDRIIIGTKSEHAFKVLKNIFLSTKCDPNKIIWTDNISAETIKYVSNSFLAMKVSFINEIANFCDSMGIDIKTIVQGLGLDNRIGNQFLKPGPGFGGSCFPKDLIALVKMAEDVGLCLELLKATILINDLQKKIVIKKLKSLLNDNLTGKTIAILGLAFKGNTDDVRYSPAIDIIKELKKENVIIKAYDPKATNNMKIEIPDIIYCDNAYDTANKADAILLLTDWQEFKKINFDKIYDLMNTKIIFDTRNILDLKYLKKIGFTLDTIGRSTIAKRYLNVTQNKNHRKSLLELIKFLFNDQSLQK